MRNMSFMLTTEQIKNKTKTVTRRLGWKFLKPGDLVQPVVKCMGLKKGEKMQKIGAPVRRGGVMTRNNEEHRIQKAIIEWRDAVSHMHWRIGMLYAIPNGGNRDAITGAIMKAEGQLKGMVDLCLPIKTEEFGALYIEVKKPGGRLSPEQKEIIPKLRKAGNKVIVVYSTQSAIDEVCEYLGIEN